MALLFGPCGLKHPSFYTQAGRLRVDCHRNKSGDGRFVEKRSSISQTASRAEVPKMTPRTTIPLRSGNRMPVLGLGTWQLTRSTATTIAEALELGYSMIDTSGDYGTQQGIGRGVRESGVGRQSLCLVTKVEETDNA